MTPGLFLTGMPSEIENSEVRAFLSAAPNDVLVVLGHALSVRDDDLSRRVVRMISQQQPIDSATLKSVARTANANHREASMAVDLSKANLHSLTGLANSMQGRYALAQGAIMSAVQLRSSQAQNQAARIFVLLLAAVCDIAGPED